MSVQERCAAVTWIVSVGVATTSCVRVCECFDA